MVRLLLALGLLAGALAGPRPASALDIKIVENQMILSGEIESNDAWTFSRTLANNPKVDTIVLRNMPGGKVDAMERMAATVEDRKLHTVISARCMSACAHIFMAGETRRFSSDFPPEAAHLAFHSAYRSEGALKGWGGTPVTNAHLWYVRRSGGKLDPGLALRWMSLEHSSGFAFFFDPAGRKIRSSYSYLCTRTMPMEQCEKIDRSAFDLGLITSMEPAQVKDLAFWKVERYQKVAPVNALLEGDAISSTNKATLADYIKKTGSRAAVLSSNGTLIWEAHKVPLYAIMFAVWKCEAKAHVACHVIALDDHLTLSPVSIKARKFD